MPMNPTAPRRTRRVHALAHLVTEQLKTRTGEADWLREALVVDLLSDTRTEIRLGLGAFFEAAKDDYDVALSVDEQAGELVITLVDADGKPIGQQVSQPPLPTGP
jgi:hypothetical protein